jgi:hypothetical protein
MDWINWKLIPLQHIELLNEIIDLIEGVSIPNFLACNLENSSLTPLQVVNTFTISASLE